MERIFQQYMYAYPHKTAYYPVAPSLIAERLKALSGICSLYLHVPFCQAKCGYCNLFSVVSDALLHNRYIAAVERQCDQLSTLLTREAVTFDSLVLGGGTPSILTREQLARLLQVVECKLGVSLRQMRAEIEVAPNQASEEMLSFLKEVGFDRVSIGVQSFLPEELRLLGRIHSPAVCKESLSRMKAMGFSAINSDLIYGLPGQTTATLLYSIETLLSYQPDEIFLYPLYIKPHTPLFGKVQPDEQQALALYRFARGKLLQAGYTQLSMRRFVLAPPLRTAEGCGFEQSLALGCGGRSYLGNLHICEPYQIKPRDCAALLDRFCDKTDFLSGLSGYLLDEDEQKRRYLIKNLMYRDGLSCSDYTRRFGETPEQSFPWMTQLLEKKLLNRSGEQLTLTEEGCARSDQIGPMFISPKVAQASQRYYAQDCAAMSVTETPQ